jgi:hypothetical protein
VELVGTPAVQLPEVNQPLLVEPVQQSLVQAALAPENPETTKKAVDVNSTDRRVNNPPRLFGRFFS